MGIREDIQAEIDALQVKLDQLNTMPEDTFNFGTVILFAGTGNRKSYFVKHAEELWTKIKNGEQKSLYAWILQYLEVGSYFEVYVMTPQETPIYASA